MKLKLIALAAMLAAGSANANIVDGSGGNGELFMTVLDSVGQTSYTLDLSGVAVAGASYNYAADANMTSFLGMVAAENKSGLVYAIGAMDATGTSVADHHRYVTTASVIDPVDTNGSLKALGTSGAQFVADANNLIGASNSLIVTDPGIVAYAGSAQWGSNWGSKFNGVSTGLIGSDLNMYLFEQTTGASGIGPTNPANQPSVYASILQGGSQVFANLDMSGNLTIAALGLVGFMVARRRQA
jgi:hypothetical protein